MEPPGHPTEGVEPNIEHFLIYFIIPIILSEKTQTLSALILKFWGSGPGIKDAETLKPTNFKVFSTSHKILRPGLHLN